MISKKSAVSATRHDLQDATQSNKPRKMSESVCLYRCGEAASAPSPMETQFNGYFFFCLFCFASGNNSGSKDTNGRKVSCSHQEWAWVLHLGFCTHSAGLGGRAHFLAPLLLVPDQRWCGASQHQCLRSSTSDRNWCCWCSSRGCNAVLQYQANGKNRDTQDYCAMDL